MILLIFEGFVLCKKNLKCIAPLHTLSHLNVGIYLEQGNNTSLNVLTDILTTKPKDTFTLLESDANTSNEKLTEMFTDCMKW
jgi:hypothetical protein